MRTSRTPLPLHRLLLGAGLLSATLGAALPLGAQQPDHAMVLTQLPASVRAAALGGAYTLGAGEPEDAFYNPALAGNFGDASASAQWYGSAATVYTVALGGELVGVPLALGLQTVDYGLGDDASLGAYGDEARLGVGGADLVSERVLTLAANHRLFGVRLGVAGKVLERRVALERRIRPAADVSVGANVGFVRLGLTAHDLGPAMDIAGADVDLPTRATLAATTRQRDVGPLDVLATAALTSTVDGDLTGGGGVEVSYWPISGRTFTARAGWRELAGRGAEPLTLGGAITLDGFQVEYAWQRVDSAHVHRVGVRLR